MKEAAHFSNVAASRGRKNIGKSQSSEDWSVDDQNKRAKDPAWKVIRS